MAEQDALSTYDHIRLTLSSSYYSVRRALRLNLLRDLLTQSALATDAPIWVMGREFALSGQGSPEGQEAVRGLAKWLIVSALSRKVFCSWVHVLMQAALLVTLAQVLRDMICCFQSVLWMTYRTSFTPIGRGLVLGHISFGDAGGVSLASRQWDQHALAD